MDNKIKLLKNNEQLEIDDLECMVRFFYFLQNNLSLTPKKSFHIIYYLQEHLPLFPDNIEKCSICKSLYDSCSGGYYSEITLKFYCNNCYPSNLEEKEEKILLKRSNKLKP